MIRNACIFVAALLLFAIPCYLAAPNTLDGVKYYALGPNPIPVNNAAFGGWRCNTLTFGAAVAAAGPNNQGAATPGIYFYYNNVALSPTFLRVLYIGKSAVNNGQRLGDHRRNDHFCSGAATDPQLQDACGYCWYRSSAGGTRDYDTYFWEALLLLSFCSRGNDPLNGGTWGGQTCQNVNPPTTGRNIIDVFNIVYLNLPAILQHYVNALPPKNLSTQADSSAADHPMPSATTSPEHDKEVDEILAPKGALKGCEDDEIDPKTYSTIQTTLSTSYVGDGDWTLVGSVLISAWAQSLQGLNKYLQTDIFDRQFMPAGCVPESQDEVLLSEISNGISIYGFYTTHGAQSTRAEFYGTMNNGNFQSTTPQCTLFLWVSSLTGGPLQFLQDFEMNLVTQQTQTGAIIYTFENEQVLLSDIQTALSKYYIHPNQAAADYAAIFTVLDKTIASINQCATQATGIPNPPLYCDKCLQGLC